MDLLTSRVASVRLESVRLTDFLRNLPPESWNRQSACELWQVADVVSHLASGAELYAQSISRGIAGDTSAPPGFPPPRTVDQGTLGYMSAQLAISRRKKLGAKLKSEFDSTDDQFNRLLAGLGPDDWNQPCYHPMGLLPVSTFVSLRLFELALHGWDIRSSFDPSTHLSDASIPVLIELILEIGDGLLQPPPGEISPVRCRFELEGTVSGSYDIVSGEGSAAIEVASSAPATARYTTDAESFVLLMTGRLPLDAAIAGGRITVGDATGQSEDFSTWFKGVWRPAAR